MWEYEELRKTLAALYYTQKSIVELLIRAGLSPGHYDLEGKASVVWTLLLKTLEDQRQGKLKRMVQAALEDYSENPVLLAAAKDEPTAVKSVYAGDTPAWKGTPSKRDLEKIMGDQNTLLPISFLEKGMQLSNAVARIVTPDGLGTGFLISKDNLLLTNNHVLDTAAIAGKSKVQFNYQKTLKDLMAPAEDFIITADGFQTSVTDDWSVVKVEGDPAAKYGFIPLKNTKVRKDDFVNIIQHPGGEHKQIAMYHNVVTYADDRIVQYLTDTMPGSSGSPVFNSKWEVVALHHSGGWLEEPGMPTEVLRNEGITIGRIIDVLKAKGFNI